MQGFVGDLQWVLPLVRRILGTDRAREGPAGAGARGAAAKSAAPQRKARANSAVPGRTRSTQKEMTTMLNWLFGGTKLTAEDKQVGDTMFFLQDLHC